MNLFKSPFAHLIFYVAAFTLLIVSHQLAPTNMAGPGVDIWVLLCIIIGMMALFFMGMQNTDEKKHRLLILLTHACGVGLLAYLLAH